MPRPVERRRSKERRPKPRPSGAAWSAWYALLNAAGRSHPARDDLVVRLARSIGPGPGMASEPASSTVRLERARRFMERHYNRAIDGSMIARHAGLSRYHFIRSFRRTFRETPNRYLQRTRIQRACELLANTDLSVTAVCYAVGFESPGSFSGLFRRIVGQPPSVYRARTYRSRLFPGLARIEVPGCFLEQLA